jgi:membrane protease YdiL (CAAX protease family)
MAAIFVQTALIQFVGNIFEEAGFRGYLAPRAFGLGWHTLGVHGLVGLVWGVWYFPYLRAILAPVTPYAAESFLTLGPRFLLGAVAASLVYGELRLRTDSLWPAVLMQTIGGAFIAAVALNGQLVFEVGRAFVFMPMVEGLLMSALFAALGLALYFTRTVIK